MLTASMRMFNDAFCIFPAATLKRVFVQPEEKSTTCSNNNEVYHDTGSGASTSIRRSQNEHKHTSTPIPTLPLGLLTRILSFFLVSQLAKIHNHPKQSTYIDSRTSFSRRLALSRSASSCSVPMDRAAVLVPLPSPARVMPRGRTRSTMDVWWMERRL
ncbi:hypothetical protein G7K_5696-t1 [Saitoella complicata NRRL Y-17804]|uniref:Uncharacterized protein n=1 Tax=Saitoella complicata (strain BCRC 22490 / CBS 7301 / JCM 7358 / NBRC 10748 / NRRL Y-17804) TaxID=698492 RepID=A0A0E9NP36_SAICN|nr:hypothetical protein G7K_5696-t1 [Saitoella complicata NRRL Y-17804]